MRTQILCSIGLASVLLTSTTCQAAVSPNILNNPGFDSGLNSWVASNADYNRSITTTGFDVITLKPYEGNYFADDTSSHISLSQSGDISGYIGGNGNRIYAGVYTTTDKRSGVDCQLTITYYDISSKIISQDTTGKTPCATTRGIWQELKMTNSIPIGTVSVSYALDGLYTDSTSNVLFDSAYLMIESCDSTCPPYSPLWGFKTVEQIITDTRTECQTNPATCGIQVVTQADVTAARDSAAATTKAECRTNPNSCGIETASQAEVTAARDGAAAIIDSNLNISLPLAYLRQNGLDTPLSAEFEFTSVPDGSFVWKLKSHQFK